MIMREEKEEGIVLSTVKYGESGIVADILTRGSGRKGYMASAGRKRGGGQPILTPLTTVDFVGRRRRENQMSRMGDVRLSRPFRTIPFNPVRRAEAFFIAELMSRAIPPEIPDPDLFDFASQAIGALDDGMEGDYNFHLYFMMRLAEHLGFGADTSRDGRGFFDMAGGTWVESLPPHPDAVGGRMADIWHWASTTTTGRLAEMEMNRSERQELIRLMTRYYKIHQPGFGDMASQQILAML